jgi:hypothetical protein
MSDAWPAALEQALAEYGLLLRGSWAVGDADDLPHLDGDHRAGRVWMVGVAGSQFWPYFKASPFFTDGMADPLDRWSRSIGESLAARFGGCALFPFTGPPYWPFQQWAERCEPLQASLMMLRIHPEYGLWHAYRFALALPVEAQTADVDDSRPANGASDPARDALADPLASATSLCANCDGQPCLHTCPVGAYTVNGFAIDACSGHLHSKDGQPCMETGCLARQACPVGVGYRYAPEHAAFHMRAFAQRH